MPPAPPLAPRWRVVVPVKHAHRAKSRLLPPQPLTRPDLARAVAHDTLAAAAGAVGGGALLVVTSDPAAGTAARALGAGVEPDPGGGLDAAVRAGVDRCRTESPGHHVAVLLGDLPALTPEELTEALAACAAHPRAVVPDRHGTGSALLTAAPGVPLEPRFGHGSADRHASDAALLALPLPGLRTDVDDLSSLREAARLGVGRYTAAVLDAAGAALTGEVTA